MRSTSRYLILRAEQVSTTPVDGVVVEGGGGEELVVVVGVLLPALGEGATVGRPASVRVAAVRRAMSQSQRSASVRGWPSAILVMLACGWNCEC